MMSKHKELEAEYYRSRIKVLGIHYPGCRLIAKLIKEAEQKGINIGNRRQPQ